MAWKIDDDATSYRFLPLNHCILRGPRRTILRVGPLRGRGEDSRSVDRARRSSGGSPAAADEETTTGEQYRPAVLSPSSSSPPPLLLLLLLPGRRHAWSQLYSSMTTGMANDTTVKCFVRQPQNPQVICLSSSVHIPSSENSPSAISRCFFLGSMLFLHSKQFIHSFL